MRYPTEEQWAQHERFISQVRKAANAPKTEIAVADKDIWLGQLFGPAPRSTLLGGFTNPETIAEMFHLSAPPFESDEKLPEKRVDRIQKLLEWLSRLPAQQWLEGQPAIMGGFKCFKRLRCKKSSPPAYRDDLSEFAYWRLAHKVTAMLEFKKIVGDTPKPPDAGQRRRAAQAARDLLQLSRTTSLLKSAGVEFKSRDVFVSALEHIEAHEFIGRRKRVDAYTMDREVVDLIALLTWYTFGDVSPTMVCELASMSIGNPDKVAITKRLSEWKRGRPGPMHRT